MFCHKRIISTGAARVAQHFAECVLAPPSVKDSAIALKTKAEGKRVQSKEHKAVVCEEADAQMRELKVQKYTLGRCVQKYWNLLLDRSCGFAVLGIVSV